MEETFEVHFEEGLLKLQIDDKLGVVVIEASGIPDVLVGDVVVGAGDQTFPSVDQKEALAAAVRTLLESSEAVPFHFARPEMIKEARVQLETTNAQPALEDSAVPAKSDAPLGGGVGLEEPTPEKTPAPAPAEPPPLPAPAETPPEPQPEEPKPEEPKPDAPKPEEPKPKGPEPEEPKPEEKPPEESKGDKSLAISGMPSSGALGSASRGSEKFAGVITEQKEDHKTVLQKIEDDDMKRMLKAAARVAGKEVTKQKVVDHLTEEVTNNHACLEFPFVILFFVSFALTVILHENIVDVSQVERNFRSFFQGTGFEGIYNNPAWPVSGHKTIDDIALVSDVWEFLHDAIVPLFLNDNTTTSNEELYRVIRYNQLVGGFQLRQTRRKKVNCQEQHPDLGPFDSAGNNPFLQDFDCFPGDTIDDVCYGPGVPHQTTIDGFCPQILTPGYIARRLRETEERLLRRIHRVVSDSVSGIQQWFRPSSFWGGRRLAAAKHAARSRLGAGKSKSLKMDPFQTHIWENSFVSILYSGEGLTEGLRRLNQLKDNTWLDEQSGMLEITAITFNPDLAVYTQSFCSIFFVPDGGIIPYVQTTSFNAEPYRSGFVIVTDIFWLLCWLQVSLTFLVRLFKTKGIKKSIGNFYMWMDFCSLGGGIAMIVFWIVYVDLLETVKQSYIDSTVARPAQYGGANYAAVLQTYKQKEIEVHERMAELVAWTQMFRVGTCWYTLLATMRFFKAFAAQPKLAVVTNTLANCFVDFIHFFIVFWTMFMSYVLAAMFLFGHRIADFSDTEMAMTKCFLMLLGDFDFDELMEENPVTAGLWFYTFCIFMTQIILNMMLAIIMDTYSGVQADAAGAVKLWEQCWDMFYEFVARNKNHVPAVQILQAIEKMPEDLEYVGVDNLMKACPDMGKEQAESIIEKVEKLELSEEDQSLGMADAMKLIVSIRMNVLDIDKTLLEYVKCEKETRNLLLGKPLKRSAGGGGGDVVERPGATKLHPDSDRKIKAVESRLDVIETFLNEAMCYLVFRGKELRNRLQGIEERLSGQRDQAFIANQDLWESPPTLGGRTASSAPLANAAMSQSPTPGNDRMLPIAFSA